MGRRLVKLLAAVLMAAGIVGGAMSPAAAQVTRTSTTWVGTVEQHGAHYDYVGSACPVEVEICIAVEARYRIVPLTRQARLALPAVAGGRASLEGFLVARSDRTHQGILFVEQVAPEPEPQPA